MSETNIKFCSSDDTVFCAICVPSPKETNTSKQLKTEQNKRLN